MPQMPAKPASSRPTSPDTKASRASKLSKPTGRNGSRISREATPDEIKVVEAVKAGLQETSEGLTSEELRMVNSKEGLLALLRRKFV